MGREEGRGSSWGPLGPRQLPEDSPSRSVTLIELESRIRQCWQCFVQSMWFELTSWEDEAYW
jgi:hypothetical protein